MTTCEGILNSKPIVEYNFWIFQSIFMQYVVATWLLQAICVSTEFKQRLCVDLKQVVKLLGISVIENGVAFAQTIKLNVCCLCVHIVAFFKPGYECN